jgi:HEAT repeat protein
VRHKAAVTLESFGREAEAAVPNLIEALSDEDDFVREWAAHALGAIGPAAVDAVPALT